MTGWEAPVDQEQMCYASTGRQKQEDQEHKVILDYRTSSRSAWAKGDPSKSVLAAARTHACTQA